MDDVVKLALRVLDATRAWLRDQARAHPYLLLGAAGFLISWLVVVAGGRVGTVRTTIPLTNWLGLLSREPSRPTDYWPSGLMLGGIAALVTLWLLAVRVNKPGRCTEATVWGMAAAWSVPFVVGPPLLSSDVYSYAAQGLMTRLGIDPYSHGPSALGNIRAVAAVDPAWRSEPSPYGPLGTLLEHLAVAISGGSPLGAVIMFRALAVVSTIALGLLAAELAGPRRVQALTLTVLNPLVLLHVVSAAHFEGVMCALLLGSLVAANQRRWVAAILLGCAAGAVKAPAFVVVLAIIVVHSYGLHGRLLWRTALRDCAVAVAGFGVTTLLVPNGLGWTKALDTPTLGHTPLAPASLIADLFTPIVRAASFDDRAAAGRITALLAAVCIVLWLLATANRRALNRTVGYALLALAFGSPVMYPWYLLWGIVCLLPTARAPRLDWLLVASAIACVFSPPGFHRGVTNTLTVVAIAVALAVMTPRILRRRRAARHAPHIHQLNAV